MRRYLALLQALLVELLKRSGSPLAVGLSYGRGDTLYGRCSIGSTIRLLVIWSSRFANRTEQSEDLITLSGLFGDDRKVSVR